MRNFSSTNKVFYNIITENNKTISFNGIACYSAIRQSKVKKLIFYNFRAYETKKYTNFFLHYVGDMLKLNYTLTEKEFTVAGYPNQTANLIIATLVRMLFEGSEVKPIIEFCKLLKNGKSRYRNKLKRFCDFYSRLTFKYLAVGHTICSPEIIKCKSTQDFLNIVNNVCPDNLTYVSKFFKQGEVIKK